MGRFQPGMTVLVDKSEDAGLTIDAARGEDAGRGST